MKAKLLIAITVLGLTSFTLQAQDNTTRVKRDRDGDVKSVTPDSKLKVDRDGDAKLKMSNGRKVKVDKDGRVKMKPRSEGRQNGAVMTGPPDWAPAHGYRRDRHVYFQDYYTFYDPNRGYIYWNDGRWTSSRTMPRFLTNVDLGKARIQILNDLDLETHPEDRYNTYQKLYPAQRVEVDIPVPTVR